MPLKKVRYPVDEELLHKKQLGKNTLRNIIIRGIDCTTGYAGEFYHYTSPEGLMGILKTRTLYFTDCNVPVVLLVRVSLLKMLRVVRAVSSAMAVPVKVPPFDVITVYQAST